jgi:hypothetical protein
MLLGIGVTDFFEAKPPGWKREEYDEMGGIRRRVKGRKVTYKGGKLVDRYSDPSSEQETEEMKKRGRNFLENVFK